MQAHNPVVSLTVDELDEYGAFNTRYEGVGELSRIGGGVNVYFEARQLFDGRLLIACVSNEAIPPNAVCLSGQLLSGESFSTVWGTGITEIFRAENPSKVHYSANMMRVRYTKDSQPDTHSMKFALHNFIPGPSTDTRPNRIDIPVRGATFSIRPVDNYAEQSKRLLRYGGNLRTSWAEVSSGSGAGDLHNILLEALIPISLALGTLATSPQSISFDSKENRNDVEHYGSPASPFASYICSRGWDTCVTETTVEWFRERRDRLLPLDELRVLIPQHLDACSTNAFLETRALGAASLLDVLAGRHLPRWKPNVKPHQVAFKDKLQRLLLDLQIPLTVQQVDEVIAARNSLVHAGQFVTSTSGREYDAFEKLLLLGRTILLRLVGVPTTMYRNVF